jgi:solute carrier family 35 (UDP-sugar transporter), member A1/2/3
VLFPNQPQTRQKQKKKKKKKCALLNNKKKESFKTKFKMIPLKYAALLALVIQTTSAVILTRYSKIFAPVGTAPYYSTSLVVSSEMTKLIASLLLVFFVDIQPPATSNSASSSNEDGKANTAEQIKKDNLPLSFRFEQFKELLYKENFSNLSMTFKLAIPAGLYTLQNNLIYVALSNLEPTTFQVGYQMKVITTAVLSVIILSRSLSCMKWTAICLLAFGIVLTQVEGGGKDSGTHSEDQSFSLGIVSVIICGCSSALAGVYFEKILKGTPTSVWMRNAQLAFFSVLFGMGGCIFVDGVFLNFFQGYYSMVWAIIMVQAIGGLIVAVVVKYADNILKGFATAISIVVCGLTSAYLFGFVPSALFFMGSIVVIIATMLYSLPDAPAATTSVPKVEPAAAAASSPNTADPNKEGGEFSPISGVTPVTVMHHHQKSTSALDGK